MLLDYSSFNYINDELKEEYNNLKDIHSFIMEENVNFDNEVLAYLTIRKVTTVGMALPRPIGSID